VVEAWYEDTDQPGLLGAPQDGVAIRIELVIIKMTVGIGKIHRIFKQAKRLYQP
jgi:hypothetical protein